MLWHVCKVLMFPPLSPSLCVTMTGPVGGDCPVIDTLVFAFLCEGRAATVGGTPSVSMDSAACLGSATAAFPMGKKVELITQTCSLHLFIEETEWQDSSQWNENWQIFFFLCPGARCKVDTDCRLSMCCARHHGEQVCKRRLTRGESCYIPDGGLAFSINQICPCEEGLLCRKNRASHQREWVQPMHKHE